MPYRKSGISSSFVRISLSPVLFCFALAICLSAPMFAQVQDTLYLPDSLGGCSDINYLFTNKVMNRIYVWSERSDVLGVLDGTTGERLPSLRGASPDANYVTDSRLAFNPNMNRLYESSNTSTDRDTEALVFDCSTQVVTGRLVIPLHEEHGTTSLTVNPAANAVLWTTWRGYPAEVESTFTYVFSASNNQLVGRVRSFYYVAEHQNRAVAYSYTPRWDFCQPIYVIDVASAVIQDSIVPPPDYGYYQALVSSSTERLFAAARSRAQAPHDLLHIINCLNNQVVGEAALPARVDALTYNSVDNKLYVLAGGKNYIIDAATAQVTDSLALGGTLLYNPGTDQLYELGAQARSFKVVDGATNQVIDEIPIPAPAIYGTLNSNGSKLFLCDAANIDVIDCNTRVLERAFKLAYVNQNLMWQPVTNRLYVNDVYRDSLSSILTVYDANTNQPLRVLDFVGRVPAREWFYDFTTATLENKIYLASGHVRGIYVLEGNSESLLTLIPCQVGGHQMVYSAGLNKLYAVPFTDFQSGYLYIIDCHNDVVRDSVFLAGTGNGYVNPWTGKFYVTVSNNEGQLFIIDGISDTAAAPRESLGLPLAFRNRGNAHQVYVGSISKGRIYVFDAVTDSVVDSVPNVPVTGLDQFMYYDSLDDRIFYPQNCGTMVIDCAANRVMDTILFPSIQIGMFPEGNLWDPISDRFYTYARYDERSRRSVVVIDCRENRIVDSFSPLLSPTRMTWNSTNNTVYVNDHWRSKVVAIHDDLIGISEGSRTAVLNSSEFVVYPSIGRAFSIRRAMDCALKVYDASGRAKARIEPRVSFLDAHNLAPGIYFIRPDQDRAAQVRKITVVK